MSGDTSTLVELQCWCAESVVETLSDALMDLGAQSVTVEDADQGTPQERALYGEPGLINQGRHAADDPALTAAGGWDSSRLSALFLTAELAHIARATLQDLCQQEGLAVRDWQLVEVPAQDWVRLTQAQFEPIPITPQFAIVPSWHDGPQYAQTTRLLLDPGLAFGTGSHPTTRMCLQWLCAQNDLSQHNVLDYGCGSGILALSAALLGAAHVTAIDIDPAAVQATRDNAARNAIVCADAQALTGHGLRVGLPDDPALQDQRYNIVLANILASPLKVLAPLLCARLAPKGQLVLAGILARQAEEIAHAYAPWLALSVLDSQDGWVLMGGCL